MDLFGNPFSGVGGYLTEYAGFIFLAAIIIVVIIIMAYASMR